MLAVRDLAVRYDVSQNGAERAVVRAVDGVSFDVRRGEALGIIGESGSGKTSLALAMLGLLPDADVRGEVRLGGEPLPLGDRSAMRRYQWRRMALVFQGAGSSFDPVYRIGQQIIEPMLTHLDIDQRTAQARARELLARVGLAPHYLERYPHQMSGGEKQRALIAMALSCQPDVLVLDEPLAGQDILTRIALIDLFQRLKNDGLALVVIAHDLSDVARLADRIAVMYAGQIVETGPTGPVLDDPAHPYTWGLVNAYPLITRAKDLWGIRGSPPDPTALPQGCRFHPRCTQAVEECRLADVSLAPTSADFGGDGRSVACHLGGIRALLRVEGLSKTFRDGGHQAQAVRGASMVVREGEVVALVGQSGSGKTTLARLVVGLESPDEGSVVFQGEDLLARGGKARKKWCGRVQLIFQDPFEALSPRMTVAELVREPLDVRRLGSLGERDERVLAALRAVNLPTDYGFLRRHTHQLSGGQLQRVAIARALVLDPKLVIADEPVSMLDASERAKVLQLLKRLQNERGMALLLISHDLALVRKVADRIAVMHRGEIVEQRPSHLLLESPRHEQTRAMVSAARSLLAGQGSDVAALERLSPLAG